MTTPDQPPPGDRPTWGRGMTMDDTLTPEQAKALILRRNDPLVAEIIRIAPTLDAPERWAYWARAAVATLDWVTYKEPARTDPEWTGLPTGD